MMAYLRAQIRLPLLLKFLTQQGPAQSHQDTGTKEQPGKGSFSFHLHPGAYHVPQFSIPKFVLGRTGLPGVLTHRLTGETSHSQRLEDQLTPEITGWQEARTRT